ncbi:MAG TPA: patatin-like phospholipase family protein [Geminicoccus sp.]|jgi:NTE family protein|uniref:patatin-like phospholipase family protein n=1 Tax=Geminicoccus sp. TaxID=2024832 RepID=UPI002E33A629|nr:patatin-like phospholipase family protein [Geminicoccus sp.]HEX2526975.1 patatin-like phospholipase family protein [Geminicoccus sp.]
MNDQPARRAALVLSGGVALGAYHAGAYAALHDGSGLPLEWLAGSSTGAAIAAIIAGSPPERRVSQLKRFWQFSANNPSPLASLLGTPAAGPPRQIYNLASVMQAHLFGRPGMFRPRFFPSVGNPGLYELSPLKEWLQELVDFDLLNDGPVRVTIAATDIVSGERVVFDTGKGCRIGVEHILASCALTPLFTPVELDGRLLGDGGLSSNTPLDLVLEEPGDGEQVCFVVELFARQGSRPHSLSAALARSLDLVFGNQTQGLLQGQQATYRLRADIQRLAAMLPPERRQDPEVVHLLADSRMRPTVVLLIGQRAAPDEAGGGKMFDYSEVTLNERWERGAVHMRTALQTLAEVSAAAFPPGLSVHEL